MDCWNGRVKNTKTLGLSQEHHQEKEVRRQSTPGKNRGWERSLQEGGKEDPDQEKCHEMAYTTHRNWTEGAQGT